MTAIADNTVFLSYRRDTAGKIAESLASTVGEKLYNPNAVFIDKRAIHFGSQWRLDIEQAIERCRFFLPIITPQFPMDRLREKDDILRQEYVRAANRGAEVSFVPVLIAGGKIPDPAQFPEDPDLQEVLERLHDDNGIVLPEDPQYWESNLQKLCKEIVNTGAPEARTIRSRISAIPAEIELFGCRIDRIAQIAHVDASLSRAPDSQPTPQLFVAQGNQDCGRTQFARVCLHERSKTYQLPDILQFERFGQPNQSAEDRRQALMQTIWDKLGLPTPSEGVDAQALQRELVRSEQSRMFLLTVKNKHGLRFLPFGMIEEFYEFWASIWHPKMNRYISVLAFVEPHWLDFLALGSFAGFIKARLANRFVVLDSMGSVSQENIKDWIMLREDRSFNPGTRDELGFLDNNECLRALTGSRSSGNYEQVYNQYIADYRKSLQPQASSLS